ncbi:MAG: dTMP kinase [Lentisphaeria bacterium]|nr:dTMP kinase [Lentisphaeria bacterium]
MQKRGKKGCFITFEGMEGCGKSTQIGLLADALTAAGHHVEVSRSPGGTPVAEKIRDLLKIRTEGDDLTPETELLLFGACHAQMTRHLILPVLERGGILLSDRFFDSTTAYQGYARGLDLDMVLRINRFACGELEPDLTLVLDLDPELGIERSRRRAALETDRFDSEKMKFHRDVRQAFLDLAGRNPDRFRVIDASRSPEEVHHQIMEAVHERLEYLF